MKLPSVIKVDPEIQGGTPCFNGTRVPIRTLFDYLSDGHSLDYFLTQFPSVTRAQASKLLDSAAELMLELSHAA